jgi:hypothetical protein
MDELLSVLFGALLGGAAVAWCLGGQLAEARRDAAAAEDKRQSDVDIAFSEAFYIFPEFDGSKPWI